MIITILLLPLGHIFSYTISLEKRARSLLGFSVKSMKKSYNFKYNTQKPSFLPRSYPDVTWRKALGSSGEEELRRRVGRTGADALVVEKANRGVFTVEKSGGAAGRR
jgi:hypothetical protein